MLADESGVTAIEFGILGLPFFAIIAAIMQTLNAYRLKCAVVGFPTRAAPIKPIITAPHRHGPTVSPSKGPENIVTNRLEVRRRTATSPIGIRE